MPFMGPTRSIPTVAIILLGIAIFATGFLITTHSGPVSRVHAQDDQECTQPSDSGCLLIRWRWYSRASS